MAITRRMVCARGKPADVGPKSDGVGDDLTLSAVFRTRQKGEPPALVRTMGHVMRMPAAAPSLFALPTWRTTQIPSRRDCAYGKVAVIGQGEAACYQVSDGGEQVQLVACGNAVAAALALECVVSDCHRATARLHLPGNHTALVDGQVTGDASPAVYQTWRDLPALALHEATLLGRRCAVCLSPLNNYLIIQTLPQETVKYFSAHEAAVYSRHFGLDSQPLAARVAVIERAGGESPHLKFFTCGGRVHPSAPLTGLAVIKIAARTLPWLELGASRQVGTLAGPITLPTIHWQQGGNTDVEFPPVSVELELQPSGATWRAAA